jgi:energy-coupling factor transport system ATP-binding protein
VPEPLLRLESVTYRYAGAGADALGAVSLEVEEGELVLVAGVSGSGKSTLLRAASGLVPHFFGGRMAGRVTVGGLDTRDHGPAELASLASSLFQDPESQIVMSSVGAELALPLEARGRSGPSVMRAVEETALALGVADLLERETHSLSGGELQRVALAAALVTQPRLLLLDEPTSQLDPVAGDELIAQLRRLNEEWGTSVLLAEQRIERCLTAADRVVVFERGEIVWDGRPPEFVAWAEERAPALTPPAARMFSLAGIGPLPVGVKDARRTLRVRGLVPESTPPTARAPARRPRFGRRRRRAETALSIERLWVEFDDGSSAVRQALRGLSLEVGPGETVALLGRNGAGKSTLLRTAAGLLRPARGRADAAGAVALLLQSPSDYLVHERVADELPAENREILAELGLAGTAERDPRDLSGGERQRLALGIVLAGRGIGGGAPPAVVALDEPTRGLDRAQKSGLARRLRALAERGAAVLTATHDVEFAARLASRCVLLGRGTVMADGPSAEVLSGGRYFATEVARVLWPATGIALPEAGAAMLRAQAQPEEQPKERPKAASEEVPV